MFINKKLLILKNKKMKKLISMLAVVAFLFTINVNAQEPVKKNKKVVKTEKVVAKVETAGCDKDKKMGCCSKKVVAKAEEVESK